MTSHHSPRLTATLARLAALIPGAALPPAPPERPTAPGPARHPAPPPPAPSRRSEGLTARPTTPPPARVLATRPGPAPLQEVAPLGTLKAGPRRLLEILHALALDVLQVRGHRVTPSQLVLHQSQELLAAALGVHRVTVWRWTCTLQDAGLLDARPHMATTTHRGAAVTRTDGTLYALPLQPGHRPRLRYDDLKHQYRDLDADRKAGNTAFSALQQSPTPEGGGWFERLRTWAVAPGKIHPNPLGSSDCCTPGADGLRSVQDVAYALPLVAEAHPTRRAALVGTLAASLARALDDQHSRRYWCGVIWRAWNAEVEGRAGLQVLAAQLARLHADRREWPDLRNPAALLAARLRPA